MANLFKSASKAFSTKFRGLAECRTVAKPSVVAHHGMAYDAMPRMWSLRRRRIIIPVRLSLAISPEIKQLFMGRQLHFNAASASQARGGVQLRCRKKRAWPKANWRDSAHSAVAVPNPRLLIVAHIDGRQSFSGAS